MAKNQHNFPSVFRSASWINAWNNVWGHYVDQQALQSNQNLYLIAQPLLKKIQLATAVPRGCGSRNLASIRSEYFQFPSNCDLDSWFNNELANKCQQFIIPDIDIHSDAYKLLSEYASTTSWFLLNRESNPAYGIATDEGTFSDYLSGLGQNTRARLFNRRKRLQEIGQVVIKNIWPDIDGFIVLLNKFHQDRWGKPCYKENNLAFIKLFFHLLVEEGGEVNLSLMTINDEPISVLLDIVYHGRVYNVQAGYRENFAKNLALGSLHLGYEIESAFSNPKINYYDFMAGQGKNTDYKAAFATNTQTLVNVYLIKHRWLYWLYKLNDRLKTKAE